MTPEQPSATRQEILGPLGRFGLLVAIAVMLGIGLGMAGDLERALRTETVEGFAAAGPIHLAPDGRILLARTGDSAAAADGWIEAFDPVTRARSTLLEDLVDPVAADIAPDGTICAIGRPALPGAPAPLRCTSELTVDFGPGTVSGLVEAPGLHDPVLADIVSDGASGWFVSDPGQAAVVHVDHAGIVTVVATFHQYSTQSLRPAGLARGAPGLVVAMREPGYIVLALSARNVVVNGGEWVGGGRAIAAVALDLIPLVLVAEDGGGLVTYPVFADAERPRLVEGLVDPKGLVLLPDGRVAVVDGTRLLIVKPARRLP